MSAKKRVHACIVTADKKLLKTTGRVVLKKGSPTYDADKKAWWGWYNECVEAKKKAKDTSKAKSDSKEKKNTKVKAKPPAKRDGNNCANKPAETCVANVKCSLVYLTMKCSHGRKYQVRTYSPEAKASVNGRTLEVLAGHNKRDGDEITLQTIVRNGWQCPTGYDEAFYQVKGIHTAGDLKLNKKGVIDLKGAEAKFTAIWPSKLSNWKEYLWPFNLKPAVYEISSKACGNKESPIDARVCVYPNIDLKITGGINLGSNEHTTNNVTGQEGFKTDGKKVYLNLEYNAAGNKMSLDIGSEIRKLYDLIRMVVDGIEKVQKITDTALGLRFNVIMPNFSVSLGITLKEEDDTYKVAPKALAKFSASPLIGLQAKMDVLQPLINFLKVAGAATAGAVTAIVSVLDFARKELGAGIFFSVDAILKGEGECVVDSWSKNKWTGNGTVGGELIFKLELQAAKPGTSFWLRFLSNVKAGGLMGFEAVIKDFKAQTKGITAFTEINFTGLKLFMGKAVTAKTTTISEVSGGVTVLDKFNMYRSNKYYIWGGD